MTAWEVGERRVAQTQTSTLRVSTPDLRLMRGLAHGPAPMFLIGSPGREMAIYSQRQPELLSYFGQPLPPPREQYTRKASAIQVGKVPIQVYKLRKDIIAI
jgi:hypothetical protein